MTGTLAIPAKRHLLKGGQLVGAALIGAVVSMPITCSVTKHTNTAMVMQQQQLSDLQTFENTGAALDSAVGQFANAIAASRDLRSTRQSAGNAISTHSSSAFAMRDVLGPDYAVYAQKLVELRDRTDSASSPREAVAVFQSLSDLIALRNADAKRAKSRVAAQ